LECPCIISEDGTALQVRLDFQARDKGKEVHVFGLCGGSFTVDTMAEFKKAAQERKLASILYAYTLVPLARGAPAIPIFAFLHDNTNRTFTPELLEKIWRYLWQVSAYRLDDLCKLWRCLLQPFGFTGFPHFCAIHAVCLLLVWLPAGKRCVTG
jgi:hypothetical protein